MCVGARDVSRLMGFSLRSCVRYFSLLRQIRIVTNDVPGVRREIRSHGIHESGVPIEVYNDLDVGPWVSPDWPGWYRQQVIRLHADQICDTSLVACLSADAVLLREFGPAELLVGETPILYFNRYQWKAEHLKYERERVRHVGRLLRITPRVALPLGDFIMDFMLLEARVLRSLRDYLEDLHGPAPFADLVTGKCETAEERLRFGEWTLYAVYLLDVLKESPPIRNSQNRIIAQVHSSRELELFDFNAGIVHFVDKGLDIARILPALSDAGLT